MNITVCVRQTFSKSSDLDLRGGTEVLNGVLRIKLQLACGREWAFGPGKADLLESIDLCGSISAAARSMGMSYRRAWLLVDTMNRCWARPLVDATPGGGGEKGARLTSFGREVLAAYRALEARLAEVSASEPALRALTSTLRDQPADRSPPPA